MIDIRQAEVKDVALLAACQVAMAMETESLALDEATVQRGVMGVLERPERGRFFIAGIEGRPAGCLLIQPEWSEWRNKTVWWIHSVYILPEFRRLGVYSAFYDHLKQMVMADEQFAGLRLYVDRTNTKAQRAYEKMGMDGQHYIMYEWMKD